MAKKRAKKGYKHIRGTNLKEPGYSFAFRGAKKVERRPPSKPRPEVGYREYDLNRLDKGGTKTGGIWELSHPLFEGLSILADELRKKAAEEMPGLEKEILELRMQLESDLITEEEYQRKEKEIRAQYEEKEPPPKTNSGTKRAIKR